MSRIDFTGDRDYYVDAVHGVDTNDGLSPASPRKTVNSIYDDLGANYDLRWKNVRVHSLSADFPGFTLNGELTGKRTPESFLVMGAASAWNAPGPNHIQCTTPVEAQAAAKFAIQNFQIVPVGGFGVVVEKGSIDVQNCWFGGFANAALDVCGDGSEISVGGFATILFEDMGAFAIAEHGQIWLAPNFFISGGPRFRNAFSQVDLGGYIDFTGATVPLYGAASGKRYKCYGGGNIESNGLVLPGNQPGEVNGGFYQ
jgi:hypothetical protein